MACDASISAQPLPCLAVDQVASPTISFTFTVPTAFAHSGKCIRICGLLAHFSIIGLWLRLHLGLRVVLSSFIDRSFRLLGLLALCRSLLHSYIFPIKSAGGFVTQGLSGSASLTSLAFLSLWRSGSGSSISSRDTLLSGGTAVLVFVGRSASLELLPSFGVFVSGL